MTLLELIHEPALTAQQILAAADDPNEVLDAAAVVFAQAEHALDTAQLALGEHDAALEKWKTCVGSPESAECLAALDETGRRANVAVAAAQKAWQQYQPWQEAMDQIDAALDHMRIIQSN